MNSQAQTTKAPTSTKTGSSRAASLKRMLSQYRKESIEDSVAVARWETLPPYERWRIAVPVSISGKPSVPLPESRVVAGAVFNPAQLFGVLIDDVDDPLGLGPNVLGHRTWTAIGRLYGCLSVGRHHDAPRFSRDATPALRWRCASVPDFQKLVTMAHVAVTAVTVDGWIDSLEPTRDELTAFDMLMPQFLASLAGATSEQALVERGLVCPPPKSLVDTHRAPPAESSHKCHTAP
jgi:hypothetical protein